MERVTILRGDKFSLESHGNGWAYTLRRHEGRLSIWLQDDDASTFRDELDSLERAFPYRPLDDVLSTLWGEYSSLASPDE
jgi:hypothetical protein